MKPSMCSSPDNVIVRATGTLPAELAKNQGSTQRPSKTATAMQTSTRAQMKLQDRPKLIFKDKTKDSGNKQPHSIFSAVNTTPTPEKTVNENAHIHKPRARALGVVNKKNNDCQHPP